MVEIFKKGNPGGPGRPKGSRSIAIEIIFNLMAKYQDKFFEEMDKKAKESIVKFYDSYVQPLQPKSLDLSGEIKEKIINITRAEGSLKEGTDGRKTPDVPR